MWPAEAPVSTELISYELSFYRSFTLANSYMENLRLIIEKSHGRNKCVKLTYRKEKPLEFPTVVQHNLHFQWSLDKQNEAMN